jgi:hypothetical protein
MLEPDRSPLGECCLQRVSKRFDQGGDRQPRRARQYQQQVERPAEAVCSKPRSGVG